MRKIALVLPAFLLACAQTEQPPVDVSEQVKVSAVVQTVDMESRQILLRTDDGVSTTIVAGPEVKNLAQLDPGDRVIAVYNESIAVQMAPPGAEPSSEVEAVEVLAEPGAKPGIAAGSFERSVVTFKSYDPATKIAVVETGDGWLHSVYVRRPEVQGFASNLKKGDRVKVVIERAIAVGVTEVAG